MSLPRPWVLAALLAVGSAALSAPSLANELAWDDLDWITPEGRGCTTNLLECLGHRQLRSYYRPMVAWSFAIPEATRGGGEAKPWVYHLENLVWRALAVLFAALLLLEAFPGPAGRAAAVLLAAHPMLSPATAWVGGRTDLLALAGTCLAAWLGLKSRERPWLLVPAVAAFVFSVLAKEQAVALAPIAPLAIVWSPRVPKSKFLSTGAVLGGISLGLVALGRSMTADFVLRYSPGWSAGEHAGIIARTLGVYAWGLLLPTFAQLHLFALPLFSEGGGLQLLALALALGAAVFGWRRETELRLPLVWTALALLPVSNLLPIGSHPVAPYRLELALPGACAVLGILWAKWQARSPRLALPALGLVVLGWAALNLIDAREWQTDDLATYNALEANPEDLYHRMFLVAHLQKRHEVAPAIELLDEGLTRLLGKADWTEQDFARVDLNDLEQRTLLVYKPTEAQRFIPLMAMIFSMSGLLHDEAGDFARARNAFAVSNQLQASAVHARRVRELDEARASGARPPPYSGLP